MVPGRPTRRRHRRAAPRTRRDGPDAVSMPPTSHDCSPHPRGWSRALIETWGLTWLLPAPAGMVLGTPRCRTARRPTPRACGDGPERQAARARKPNCSRRMRDGPPARFTCLRPGPSSPHVQGWAHPTEPEYEPALPPCALWPSRRRPAHGLLPALGSESPMDSRVLQVEYRPHPAAVFCGVRSTRDRAQAGQFRQDGCVRDRETWPVGQSDDQRPGHVWATVACPGHLAAGSSGRPRCPGRPRR